jgi:mycofactocin precursor
MSDLTAPDQTGPSSTAHIAPDHAGSSEEDVVDLIEDVSIDGMCGVY